MSAPESGPVGPDGSPVELYAILPPLGEAELIHAAVPEHSEILELGCGTGRITRGLVSRGHRVVAVDESAEMLAHVRDAETVHSSIEALELGRRFHGVALASNLVNIESPELRQAFLRTCRRHVADDGVVVIQRLPTHDGAWEERTNEIGPVRTTLRDVRRSGPLVTAVAEYESDGRSWRHPFTSRLLREEEVEAALTEAGLQLREWLDDRRLWLVAEPAP